MQEIPVAKTADGAGAMTLPAALDAGLVLPLRNALAQDCKELIGVEIDAGEVEWIGTPSVQVLVAAGLTFDSEGRPFRITNASEPLKQAFSDLGLLSALERWSVE